MYKKIVKHPKVFIFAKIASVIISLLLPIALFIYLLALPASPLKMLFSSDTSKAISSAREEVQDIQDNFLRKSGADDMYELTDDILNQYQENRLAYEKAKAEIEASGSIPSTSEMSDLFNQAFSAWQEAQTKTD